MGRRKIHIQAHRGACAEFVENTIPAFRRAIELNVDSIELDVHLSRDDVVVVYHDFDITPEWCSSKLGEPVSSSTPIWEMEWPEIQTVEIRVDRRLAQKRELSASEKRIPSLKDLFLEAKSCQVSRSHPVTLDIEIKRHKNSNLGPPPAAKLVQHVLAEIYRHWDPAHTVLRSSDFEVLREVKRQAPEIRIAVLRKNADMPVADICEIFQPKIFAPSHLHLSAEEVAVARSLGVEVIPYTVNTEQEFEKMIALGVSGLTTDNPALLIQYLNR